MAGMIITVQSCTQRYAWFRLSGSYPQLTLFGLCSIMELPNKRQTLAEQIANKRGKMPNESEQVDPTDYNWPIELGIFLELAFNA